MTNFTISILLPTRGRTTQLDRSISSLIDLADAPENLQWCLGFDNDDRQSYQYFADNISLKIKSSGGKYSCYEYAPMGYQRLNEYVNDLAHRSSGSWMVFWNDDAVMQTQGWDTTINSYSDKFCLQAFDTHNKHPYSIFPIVPRKWLEIVGHFSKHSLSDAWLSQIAWMLNIIERIPVEVVHERYDLCGLNHDSTFKSRVLKEGNPADPEDFNHISARGVRLSEASKIAKYLDSQGYDLTYWNNILLGKQDPWQKMLESDVNKHLTKIK